MTQRVPYPFISGGIDDRSRREIERNFQYLTDQLVGSAITGWDAIVDPLQAADNTTTKVFKTVFAAVKFLADTGGLTDITIGVRQTATTISETANYAGTTSNLIVRVIAIGSSYAFDTSMSDLNGRLPVWNLAGFTENSKWGTLVIAGINVSKNSTASVVAASFFASTSMTVRAVNCILDGSGATSTTAMPNIANLAGINCSVINVAFSVRVALKDSIYTLSTPTSVTWAAAVLWLGVLFLGPSANLAFTFSSSGDVVWDGVYNNGGSGSTLTTFTVSSAKNVSIKLHSQIAAPPGCTLSVTSTVLTSLVVEGYFNELTTPAVVSTNGVSRISAAVKVRADITGPANIALALGNGSALVTYGLRVRGNGVNGTVALRLADSATAATALDYISATRSTIVASVARDGVVSTGAKPYNFDAGSSHNILVLEADTLGVSGADAGSSDAVITDAGVPSAPSGPAGGVLAGTYPNPSFAVQPTYYPMVVDETGVIANFTDTVAIGTSAVMTGSTTTVLATPVAVGTYKLHVTTLGFVLGNSANALRAALNLQFSMDGGVTWTVFGSASQCTVNSSTVPREQLGALGVATIVNPTGSIQVRLQVQHVSGGAIGDTTFANFDLAYELFLHS